MLSRVQLGSWLIKCYTIKKVYSRVCGGCGFRAEQFSTLHIASERLLFVGMS